MIITTRNVKIGFYFWSKWWLKMLRRSSAIYQLNLFGTDLLMQLDVSDPLLKLAVAIPWQEFDEAFSIHYTKSTGAAIEPIIGHLKLDYRMARNYLKSAIGDRINQQSIFTETSAVTGHGIGCTRHRYPFHLIWTDCYCAPDSSGRFGIYDFRYCCSSKSGRQIRNWSADSCTRSI